MAFLFFDCETNGLPKNYSASYTDLDNWPRVTQLAWAVADKDGSVISQEAHIIQPAGWEILKTKFFIENGHSTERSIELGVPIDNVLEMFMTDTYVSHTLIAHNLNFDIKIVASEIIRSGRTPKSGMNKICTMLSTTNYCKIPKATGRGYKWPKLIELHRILFNTDFDGAHDALADVLAMKDCFFELVRRGVIALPEPARDAALSAK